MADFEQFRLIPEHSWLEYLQMIRKLLPRGSIWGFHIIPGEDVVQDVISGTDIWQDVVGGTDIIQDNIVSSTVFSTSTLGKLFYVIAREKERNEQRCYDLLNESVPGLSVELVDKWFDQCVRDATERSLAITDADKAALAHGKMYDEFQTANVAFFEDVYKYSSHEH